MKHADSITLNLLQDGLIELNGHLRFSASGAPFRRLRAWNGEKSTRRDDIMQIKKKAIRIPCFHIGWYAGRNVPIATCFELWLSSAASWIYRRWYIKASPGARLTLFLFIHRWWASVCLMRCCRASSESEQRLPRSRSCHAARPCEH